jgi:hypothetical protein
MKLADISEQKAGIPETQINELTTHSMSKNITNLYRCINEFKKGYQPKINLVKDENKL